MNVLADKRVVAAHPHRMLPGIALVGVGGLLLALMLAFPERLRVPPVIGHLTAATFVLAGLLALANAFWGARARAWLAVALLACMVLPPAWIAFGPGERACSIANALVSASTSGLKCRTAFGIGALLGAVLILVAVRHALHAGRPAPFDRETPNPMELNAGSAIGSGDPARRRR